jgi:hypothetical protein
VSRSALGAGLAGTTFLVSYALLHVLHALHADPVVVRALSPIPLFARIEATAALSLALGLGGPLIVRDGGWLVRRLPGALALTMALVLAAIVIFP